MSYSIIERRNVFNLIKWNIFFLISICWQTFTADLVSAQIIPDRSLGEENSTVTPDRTINDVEADLIQGGAARGANLFHSFQEFNVELGKGAYFNNPNGIQNIIGRVTGNNASSILGTLGVSGGDANLFLLNPNGIIFGENSSVDLNGSFLATSANSLVFDNNFEFGTDNLAPPLLTVNMPIGMQFGSTPQEIINRSQGGGIETVFGIERALGLEVASDRTIGLVGGDISLSAGNITAAGKIELGAVAGDSFVGIETLNDSWRLNYDRVDDFADINMQDAWIYNSFESMGNINIQGKEINLDRTSVDFINLGANDSGNLIISASKEVRIDNDSVIYPDVDGSEFTSAPNIEITAPILSLANGSEIVSFTSYGSLASAGNIAIDATESVTLVGLDTLISSQAELGDGGNININAKRMSLQDGGRILVPTIGSGSGGIIEVNATELLELVGFAIPGEDEMKKPSQSGLFARSESIATGNAGDIRIDASNLSVRDGAEISTSSLGEAGEAGNITINDADIIQIEGFTEGNFSDSEVVINSRIVASTEGFDDGGNIQINNARKIQLDRGGQIFTSTFADGEAGSIEINNSELIEVTGSLNNFTSLISSASFRQEFNGDGGQVSITTDRLNLKDGGQITVSTINAGDGGRVTIEASEIEIAGSSFLDNGTEAISSISSRTLDSGRAGELNITTETLEISNGADITASSIATGDSGDLNIIAVDIFVNSNGSIAVDATGTGEAGSLNINASQIDLSNGSFTAETRRGSRGNININNADSLLLFDNSQITTNALELATGGDINIFSEVIALLNNSDITANAVEGRGGNISLTSQSIFQGLDSDITAASQLGIDGTITFDTPDVDPTSGLSELPEVPIDIASLLEKSICEVNLGTSGDGTSSFIMTGRGGLPPNPYEPLDSNDIFVDAKLPEIWKDSVSNSYNSKQPKPIIEAAAWVVNQKGNVELVSQIPQQKSECN